MPNSQGASLDDSILIDIRTACNVDESDNGFDFKLIPLTNTYISKAHDLGAGYEGFSINGTRETWRDWLGDQGELLMSVKTWVGYKVRLLFDPPENSSMVKVFETAIEDLGYAIRDKCCYEGLAAEYIPKHAELYSDSEDDDE